MLKKTANLFTTAYLLLIFCVYPFYVERGYENIGEAKNRFFLYISISAFVILGICAFLYLLKALWDILLQKKVYLIDWNRVSATDLFVLLYATFVFLSYVFSEYRDEALWGTEGWYMGLLPLLLLCGLYFLISRMWNGDTRIFYLLVAASALVFLLGICNRFSFYPIKFAVTQPDFISTLGNINWFCGYLSVVSPVGIGMFVLQDKKQEASWRKVYYGKKWIFGSYAMITFTAGFCQGSNSVFLWFAALFGICLWICLEKQEWIKNWLLLVILWGASAQLVRFFRWLFPGKYNYDINNLCGYFTGSSVTVWIVAAGVIAYVIFWRKDKRDYLVEKRSVMRKAMIVLVFSLLVAWLLLSLLNTVWGLSFLNKSTAFQGLFLFDESWGNGRGAAYSAGIQILKEFPLIHKLFGAGPDCFACCAYAMPELSDMLYRYFGSARLTNAHNELLTCLVNTGIFGFIFYLGIFVSFIIGSGKKRKKNPVLYVLSLSVICYFVHNMVSFAQVLNFPYLFMFAGMGRYLQKICQSR